MKQLLKIDSINFNFENNIVFDNLSLNFNSCELCSIVGSNNCGKTTLIKILSGIIRCSFKFYFNNVEYYSNCDDAYINEVNFFIYSNKLRNNKKSVISELKYWIKKYKSWKINTLDLLEEFELMKVKNEKICNLSNNDFLRFIISILLLKKPKIIYIDKLFDFFNYEEYFESIKFLKKIINKYKISIIYTTSSLDNCLCSNRVLFLSNHSIKLDGKIDYILDHDNLLARDGIIISDMLDLSLKLKFYNLIDKIELHPRKMVEKLWK